MELSGIKKMFSFKTTGKLKSLDLTDEQYRRLLHIISLGHRTVVQECSEVGLVDIEQYVQSFAGQFNSADLVEYFPEADIYLNSDSLNDKTDKIMDYYIEHIFTYELGTRLAARDFKKLGKAEDELDPNVVEKVQFDYFAEFDENDVENLQLIKPNN